MTNADRWDRFLEYVRLYTEPWADEKDDTDTYRMWRAVQLFNQGKQSPAHAQAFNPFVHAQVRWKRPTCTSSSPHAHAHAQA